MAKSLLPGCTHTHTCLAANAARRPPVRLCLQARRDPSESSTFTFARSCCVQLCRGEGCRRTALCHNTLASRTTSRRLCAEPHVSAATPPAEFALLVSPCPSITHTHPAQPTLHFALLLSQPRVTPPSVHSHTHSLTQRRRQRTLRCFTLSHAVPQGSLLCPTTSPPQRRRTHNLPERKHARVGTTLLKIVSAVEKLARAASPEFMCLLQIKKINTFTKCQRI